MPISLIKKWRPLSAIVQGCFAQSLVEIGQWFLRRRFLNVVNVFSLFRKFLPLVTGMTIRLNIDQHMNPLHPKDALYQVWLKMTQWFLKRGFLNFVNVFRKCPWKTAWPFIWTKLNSLYSRMFCAKFGWNRLSSSWEEDENVFTDRQTEGRRSLTLTKIDKTLYNMTISLIKKWRPLSAIVESCVKSKVLYFLFW